MYSKKFHSNLNLKIYRQLLIASRFCSPASFPPRFAPRCISLLHQIEHRRPLRATLRKQLVLLHSASLVIVVLIFVLRVVQQWGERVALVVPRRAPQEHDDDEDGAEEKMPETGVHPAGKFKNKLNFEVFF